ncbi:hypothetical protein GCM10010361_52340 [Streptomyces olivaceiscleroticus]|uniref:Uncharacterized protein n=1 Tax=Streptomyces olivaceiscleroticus TaxID=68245 RepID=A0ABP3KJJ6_9ACTN
MVAGRMVAGRRADPGWQKPAGVVRAVRGTRVARSYGVRVREARTECNARARTRKITIKARTRRTRARRTRSRAKASLLPCPGLAWPVLSWPARPGQDRPRRAGWSAWRASCPWPYVL